MTSSKNREAVQNELEQQDNNIQMIQDFEYVNENNVNNSGMANEKNATYNGHDSEVHNILVQMTNYDTLFNVHVLASSLDRYTNTKQETDKMLQDVKNSVELLEKKVLNIENEINAIKISHTRNNEKYKKVNNDRLKLARKVVELENVYANLKNDLDEYESYIQKYNEELRGLHKPSYNQLYLELIKGFGIEFTNDTCKIRDNKKKCLYEIKLDSNTTDYKICSDIWNKLY